MPTTSKARRPYTRPVPPDVQGAIPAEMIAGGQRDTFRYGGVVYKMERVNLERLEAYMDRLYLRPIKPRPRTGQMMWPPLVICERRPNYDDDAV